MTPIFIRYTWKTLKENRSRTWVTIVGILLSTALVTAVTVSIASAVYYFERVAVEDVGDWCVRLYEVSENERSRLAEDGRVSGLCSLRSVGYAQTDCGKEGKPYLFIGAMSEDFAERMPVELIRGRMPEKDTELLLSRQFLANSGQELSPGDSLTLVLGGRLADAAENQEGVEESVDAGVWLNQHNPFQGQTSRAPETFVADGRTVTYTVAGIYEEPEFEPSMAPGYTVLTVDAAVPPAAEEPETVREDSRELAQEDGREITQESSRELAQEGNGDSKEAGNDCYELWIQLKDLGQAQSFLEEQMAQGLSGETNWTLLKYQGYSGSSSMKLIYGMASILMVIVAAGSVALIYNSFSISVTERVRQFGLLKSLGATRRQIMGSVLTEGLMLCIVGIPLGILIGCLGIGATIWGCQELFEAVLGGFSERVSFEVHPTLGALGLSVGIGLCTVLLSAWLPARKALRLPAIEAIRQNQELRIRPRRVRTSPLTLRVFGLEGMLASKNFKRSRKRYRATVISLFFSIVLFVCANSFCRYLRKSVEDSRNEGTYDLAYYMWDDPEGLRQLYAKLKLLEGVDESVLTDSQGVDVVVAPEDQTEAFRRNHDAEMGTPWAYWGVFFIEDEDYRAYLVQNGLDPAIYMDVDHPTALVFDRMTYSAEGGSYQVYPVLKEGVQSLNVIQTRPQEGYGGGVLQMTEQGVQVLYYKDDREGAEEPLKVPAEDAAQLIEVKIGMYLESAPWFLGDRGRPQMILPASVRDAWGMEADWRAAFFLAGDADRVYEEMRKLAKETGGAIANNAQTAKETRALIGLIEVFSTGFLALISLIATTNVFNTISTNVMLRRREFAMLRSIGMTRKGTRRILNYECLLYGCKSVLYAVPVSLGITWVIYDNVKRQGFFTGFYIPWQTVASVASAMFLIVFATMVYADKKLGREELAEEIREENA